VFKGKHDVLAMSMLSALECWQCSNWR